MFLTAAVLPKTRCVRNSFLLTRLLGFSPLTADNMQCYLVALHWQFFLDRCRNIFLAKMGSPLLKQLVRTPMLQLLLIVSVIRLANQETT